ncbi:hypothetical protein [Mycobacteroides franklinii]|uniref:ESX-1 secretion-associated protein EspA/EspE-like domain-containing protein n=1 Tax=Mycobacteroides franklinii TaxID=948102 RepID=A0A4R8QYN7_9MYCO|nr:hypothetical protein [Mycobacteroides franklinii]TDZ45461.1 hypothetical protein CCUG64054_01107 [Mycobacteroides franklinii]TDZ48952.1 hypothetical protein CCUG63697_03484 [Mycobacteroides franklinii]TDZ59133.1 hypothetical protein CCUG63696_01111 [Mycobacteroides franklinii]TDZ66647.1 hypothetical protein CCUG63695_00473 [Mycobacteroides franklinii]TDZ72570.1 hypothetical protein CCUG64056_01107 [Mycobacteroides franklinii]
MDTLDAELKPLTRLYDAGLGFVVEHVQFLEEPLDALRGDPAAASVEATFWRYCIADVTNVQQELSAVLSALGDGHSGAAATGFREASGPIDDALQELRLVAANINQRINVVTDLVTHTRSMLGQWVEGYVDDVITEFTAARAASPITQGGSVATTIASVVADASELGNKMGRTLSQLLDRLDEHAAAIREGVAEFAINVERLRTPAPGPAVAAPVPVAAVSHSQPATAPTEHGLSVDPDALFAAGQGNES